MSVPRIGVAFISDRGDLHLPDCRESYRTHVLPRLAAAQVDISTHVVDDRAHELGMAGAVQAAWTWALDEQVDYLLHVEEDFRFVMDLDVLDMVRILRQSPYLAQLCLKRQPWSLAERAVGDMFGTFTGSVIGTGADGALLDRHGFLVHRRLFSLNPCLIPARVLAYGWPSGPLGVGNEAGFTKICLEQGHWFGYYGLRSDPPRVVHVGDTRAEGWRL
jgi:hypothetical protein